MADIRTIAAQQPKDLDEAIPAMQEALRFFHEHDDYRAIFLRAYYIISINVHAAIHRLGDFRQPIFFDPAWVNALAGTFSTLYFRSLTTSDREARSERAWKIAHRMARDRTSSVALDLVLGLNAHINYDLAYGIYLNLKDLDVREHHLLLPNRKFDHDQVNNILVRCIPVIAETLTRDYGGGIRLLSRWLHDLDEFLAESGLRYYRERVWWNAVSFLASTDQEEVDLVQDKLNWESAKVAQQVVECRPWARAVRAVGVLLRRKRFGPIRLEEIGETVPSSRISWSPF